MTQLTDNGIFAIQVPEDLLSPEYYFEISIGRMLDLETTDDEFIIRHRERVCGSPIGKIIIPVPSGSYEFLFCTKGASEEDVRKVVAKVCGGFAGHIEGYKDYESIGIDMQPLKTAIDSLNSLLRKKKCNPDKNYALVLRKAIASSI